MVSEKPCIVCEQVLPASEFYRQGRNKELLTGKCKKCYGGRVLRPRWEPAMPAPEGYRHCVDCLEIKPEETFRTEGGRICGPCRYRRRKKITDKMAGHHRTQYQKTRVAHIAKSKRDYWALKLEILNHYGAFCSCCGEDHPRFLTLDHTDQNGAEHRKWLGKNAKGGFYLWVRRNGFPDILRVLCYNCNNATYRNGGVCPHEEDRLRLVV